MDLYANEVQTFRRVTLPLVAPGIAGAALLAFSLSFDDYIITNFTSGAVNTFPKFVYVSAQRGIPAQALRHRDVHVRARLRSRRGQRARALGAPGERCGRAGSPSSSTASTRAAIPGFWQEALGYRLAADLGAFLVLVPASADRERAGGDPPAGPGGAEPARTGCTSTCTRPDAAGARRAAGGAGRTPAGRARHRAAGAARRLVAAHGRPAGQRVLRRRRPASDRRQPRAEDRTDARPRRRRRAASAPPSSAPSRAATSSRRCVIADPTRRGPGGRRGGRRPAVRRRRRRRLGRRRRRRPRPAHRATHVLNAVDPRFVMPVFERRLRRRRRLPRHGDEPVPAAPGAALRAARRQARRRAVRRRPERWEDAGRLALVGIGVEPGLSDVFARYAADHLFTEIDELGARDGANLVVDGYDFAPVLLHLDDDRGVPQPARDLGGGPRAGTPPRRSASPRSSTSRAGSGRSSACTWSTRRSCSCPAG